MSLFEGIGLGVGLTGTPQMPDFVGLAQQQQQQRAAQQERARQEKGRLDDFTEKFREKRGDISPAHNQQVEETLDSFFDNAHELSQRRPGDFTRTTEFRRLVSDTLQELNNLQESSAVIDQIMEPPEGTLRTDELAKMQDDISKAISEGSIESIDQVHDFIDNGYFTRQQFVPDVNEFEIALEIGEGIGGNMESFISDIRVEEGIAKETEVLKKAVQSGREEAKRRWEAHEGLQHKFDSAESYADYVERMALQDEIKSSYRRIRGESSDTDITFGGLKKEQVAPRYQLLSGIVQPFDEVDGEIRLNNSGRDLKHAIMNGRVDGHPVTEVNFAKEGRIPEDFYSSITNRLDNAAGPNVQVTREDVDEIRESMRRNRRSTFLANNGGNIENMELFNQLKSQLIEAASHERTVAIVTFDRRDDATGEGQDVKVIDLGGSDGSIRDADVTAINSIINEGDARDDIAEEALMQYENHIVRDDRNRLYSRIGNAQERTNEGADQGYDNAEDFWSDFEQHTGVDVRSEGDYEPSKDIVISDLVGAREADLGKGSANSWAYQIADTYAGKHPSDLTQQEWENLLSGYALQEPNEFNYRIKLTR